MLKKNSKANFRDKAGFGKSVGHKKLTVKKLHFDKNNININSKINKELNSGLDLDLELNMDLDNIKEEAKEEDADKEENFATQHNLINKEKTNDDSNNNKNNNNKANVNEAKNNKKLKQIDDLNLS